MAYRVEEPVRGPEAFESTTNEAVLSQAALLLSAGAAHLGRGPVFEEDQEQRSQFPLPDLRPLAEAPPTPVAQALSSLDLSLDDHEAGPIPEVAQESPRLARELYDDPTPERAATLVEACLHSDQPVVRVAAAATVLEITEPRGRVRQILIDGLESEDELTRDLSATSLAKVDPANEALRRLVDFEDEADPSEEPHQTAVVTHGTWAAHTTWWQQGGDFFSYLDALAPPLDLHSQSFRWSGAYDQARRITAAGRLVNWLEAQQLETPDLFAHSHGATVVHLATQAGLDLDRLVMLSWPVRQDSLPAFQRIGRVLSFRVRMDLVILVDGAGQRFDHPQVDEHINGWFAHPDTHEPDYWDDHDLASLL